MKWGTQKRFKSSILSLAAVVLLLSPFFSVFTLSQTASAAADRPIDQLERWLYYSGMRACLEDPWFGTGITDGSDDEDISASDVNAGKLQILNQDTGFDQKEGFGYLGPSLDGGDDGTVECKKEKIWVNGAAAFGFANVVELICEMNRNLPSNKNHLIQPSDPTDCEKSTEFKFDGGNDEFQPALTDALEKGGNKDRPDRELSQNDGSDYDAKALYYLLGKRSLEVFCGANRTLEDSATDDNSYDGNDEKVMVSIARADGTVDEGWSYGLGNPDRNEGDEVADVYYKNGGNINQADSVKCSKMAEWTRDSGNARAYADWLAANPQDEDGDPEDENGDGAAEPTSCAVDGIGWIVCPVMTFIGKMNDAAFGFLEEILSIRPAVVTSESTQTAWAAFRDIANVAFVIAFMVIVYSQITSAGISNYGIKKMLPRIVIAAILVNASFVITAIAVDISNIVGSSVYSLFENSIASDVGSEISNASWEEAITGALALATAIGVILIVLFFFIGPMALLALGLIILILVARQALVILLIVIAPLAFVAYLLPNTEDWFKKWYKAFIAVLMVYPIVGAVFGVSTLASRVLSSVASDTEDSSLLQVVALGVLAVPLFAVPAILKGSLSAAGSIGARISGLADKTQGKATARGMKRMGDAAADGKNRWNMAAANGKLGTKGWTPGGLTRRGMRRDFLRSSRDAESKRATGAYTTDLLHGDDEESRKYQRAAGGGIAGGDGAAVRAAARATQQSHKQYDEDVSAHKTTMTGMDHAQLMQVMTDKTQSSERRAAAAGTIMSRDYRAGHLEALRAAGQAGRAGDDEHIGDIQKQMAHDMSDKPFALGDQAAGQLKIGTYGAEQPEVMGDDGKPYKPPQLGDIDGEMVQRVESKLSPATLAKMNPDELKLISRLAKDGSIQGDGLKNLQSAIAEARKDDTLKGFIKPEASKAFDELLTITPKSAQDAAASSYGPGI